jgi:glutathione S-transferase
MKLVGNFLSPYTRRVAISLDVLGLPYELESLFVFKAADTVRTYNPLVRIPVLVLDDGDVLIESSAILDEIDQMVGPERALVPATGKSRRRVMQFTALAHGCMEKGQWAFYERRLRSPELVLETWIEHNETRLLAGLAQLDAAAVEAGDGGWLAGTPGISQADISAAVAFTFANAVRPGLDVASTAPHLAAFAARCEKLEAFEKSPLPAQIA